MSPQCYVDRALSRNLSPRPAYPQLSGQSGPNAKKLMDFCVRRKYSSGIASIKSINRIRL
jgi:hypothetical protein